MARRGVTSPGVHVRRGMSLLEVIVSTAIFFLSLVAIYGLLEVSQRSGVRARQRGQALRVCQARLAELVAGVLPLESADGTDEQAPDYQWQITIDPEGDSGGSLMKATAVAFYKNEPRDSRVALTQIILDPLFVGSLMDAVPNGGAASEEPGSTGTEDSSASASGGSTASSGSSTSSGGAAAASKTSGSGASGSVPRSSSASSGSAGSSAGSKTGGGTSSGTSSSKSTLPTIPSSGSSGSGSTSGGGSTTRGGR